MTLAERIREQVAALGGSLDHIDDDELGARLVAMPEEAADDPYLAAGWMIFGALNVRTLLDRQPLDDCLIPHP